MKGWFVGPTKDVGGGKGRLKLLFCRSSRNEIGVLSLRNKERRPVGSPPGILAGMACGLAGDACWSWRGCDTVMGSGRQIRRR